MSDPGGFLTFGRLVITKAASWPMRTVSHKSNVTWSDANERNRPQLQDQRDRLWILYLTLLNLGTPLVL